jgi:hypothetical protein
VRSEFNAQLRKIPEGSGWPKSWSGLDHHGPAQRRPEQRRYHGVQMADMLGRAMAAVNLHRLGLQRGLAKFEAILGPKLDAFSYTKETWGTVYLKAPAASGSAAPQPRRPAPARRG